LSKVIRKKCKKELIAIVNLNLNKIANHKSQIVN